MSIQRKSNNKRLLDALDHIDGRYVAELVEGLRLPKESAAAPAAKRSIRTSLKYAALIAACALILGAAIPVAGSLIRNLTSGMAAAGGDSIDAVESVPEQINNVTEPPEEVISNKEIMDVAFDGSPIFKATNRSSDQPERLEAYRVDGTMINLCICGLKPCICGNNSRILTCGDMIWTVESSSNGKTTFVTFDISDPDNVVYSRTTLEGFDLDTHKILAFDGTPYYYVYKNSVSGNQRISGVSILDMSNAINGEIGIREYPCYRGGANYKGEKTQIMYIDGEVVYFGITDDDSSAIIKIGCARPGDEAVTVLFEVNEIWFFAIRDEMYVENDGTVHYLREENDSKSKYGYSLYQYTWKEGEKVKKTLRATDICDFIHADGRIYCTINNPADSRQFKNYDGQYEDICDMSGGKIYWMPTSELDREPELAWTLGDEYYLYGVTQKNPTIFKNELNDRSRDSMTSFIQGIDGGIAICANKQVGENIMHVYLLIGDNGSETVMTELEGCGYWGIWVQSDAGGVTNINWQYRPEEYAKEEQPVETFPEDYIDKMIEGIIEEAKRREEEIKKQYNN